MFVNDLKMLYVGQGDWKLLDSFTYQRPNGDVASAPRGMDTDLASIPNKGLLGMMARAIIRKLGKHVRSAVLHDAGYKGVADVYDKNGETITGLYTRKDWDDLFHEAMIEEGETKFKRFVITKSVNWFGGPHFHESGEPTP